MRSFGIVQIAVSKFTSSHIASRNSDLRTSVSSMNLTAKRSVDMVAVCSSAFKNTWISVGDRALSRSLTVAIALGLIASAGFSTFNPRAWMNRKT